MLGTREEAETEGGSQKEVGSGKGLTGDIVFCSWARHFFSNNSLARRPWKFILHVQIYATPMHLTCRGIIFSSVASFFAQLWKKPQELCAFQSEIYLVNSFIDVSFFSGCKGSKS